MQMIKKHGKTGSGARQHFSRQTSSAFEIPDQQSTRVDVGVLAQPHTTLGDLGQGPQLPLVPKGDDASALGSVAARTHAGR